MAQAEPEEVMFEAVILPHRSLSPRGLRRVIVAVCGLSVLITTFFFVMGAWPVLGFSGAEVGLAVALLRWNARAGRASEMLLLTGSGLRVVRTDAAGRRTERDLPAAWLNVVLQESPGCVPALWLVSHAVREEVAKNLGEAEKRDLAAALRAALHRRRNPVFDNPQLRD